MKNKMKKIRNFIVIIFILATVTLVTVIVADVAIKKHMLPDISGKLIFEKGDTAAAPAGIYIYDCKSKRTEQLILNGLTDLGNISGYCHGSFYCSGRVANEKNYYVLKIDNLKVTAKITVAKTPSAVKKYLNTAVYAVDGTVYLADFDSCTGTVLIEDISSEYKAYAPLYVNGETIIFARQKKLEDEFRHIWTNSQQETLIPVANYPTIYAYFNGEEHNICNARYYFGFISNDLILYRDTKNRLRSVNIKTGKGKFIRYTKYETPCAR